MLNIRKASILDIPTIQEIASITFPHTYNKILSPEQITYMMEWMYSYDSLHKQIATGGHIYYIAFLHKKPVGYFSIQEEGEHTFHLQKLYILPTTQGMHIGTQLFRHAIKTIKNIHPTPCRMLLNVNRSNTARHFYEKMGMKKVEEGDFHIGNGYYMNDYIMGIDI